MEEPESKGETPGRHSAAEMVVFPCVKVQKSTNSTSAWQHGCVDGDAAAKPGSKDSVWALEVA